MLRIGRQYVLHSQVDGSSMQINLRFHWRFTKAQIMSYASKKIVYYIFIVCGKVQKIKPLVG